MRFCKASCQVNCKMYEEFPAQIAKTLGSTFIWYRSDAEVSDRCLIDVDPKVFAIWVVSLDMLRTISKFVGRKWEHIFTEPTNKMGHWKNVFHTWPLEWTFFSCERTIIRGNGQLSVGTENCLFARTIYLFPRTTIRSHGQSFVPTDKTYSSIITSRATDEKRGPLNDMATEYLKSSVLTDNWFIPTKIAAIVSRGRWVNSWRPSDAYMRRWTGPSLVQIMACRLFGAKPLSVPMMEYC